MSNCKGKGKIGVEGKCEAVINFFNGAALLRDKREGTGGQRSVKGEENQCSAAYN